MTETAFPDDRVRAPLIAGEREMLQRWLDFHRGTLQWKCQGLTGDQLVTRSAHPSTMSLLGLVRHLADVERWWLRKIAGGQPVEPRTWTDEHPDGDFDLADAALAEEDLAHLRAEIALADEAARDLDLDDVFIHPNPERPGPISLRWIYVHLIEEYARHNGHADLLREQLDGHTGE